MDTVRLRFRMDTWSIRVDGLTRIKYGWQNFIIDLNQIQSLLGYFWRLGSDSREAIPYETHDVVQAVLVVGPRFRPGLSSRCIGNARHILIRQYCMDAGKGPRLASVDIANDGMRMGAGQQAGMQHIPQFNIINKGGLAGNQLDSIHFALRFAHNAEISGGAVVNYSGCTSST